jgi:hypothetical protein
MHDGMSSKKAKRITVTEYARSRGRHESSVRRAIKAGYVIRGEDNLIDSEQADRDWYARQDRRPKIAGNAAAIDSPELMQARTMREVYNARRAKLNFEREVGELIPLGPVNRWIGAMILKAREEFLRIGAELQDELAEERNPAVIGRLIDSRVRRALAALKENLADAAIEKQ